MPLLLIEPDEVPFGVDIFVCGPGKDIPEIDPKTGKNLPPLQCLLGGVPVRPKLYPISSSEKMEGGGLKIPGSFALSAILPGVRFTPVESFSAEDAPKLKHLAVFINGIRLRYTEEKYNEFVDVSKTSSGQIISTAGTVYDHWLRAYELPKDAVLVAMNDLNSKYDFCIDDCIPLPKPTDNVREVLLSAGVKFHGTTMSCAEKYYKHEYFELPKGWKFIPQVGVDHGDVVDSKGVIQAQIGIRYINVGFLDHIFKFLLTGSYT